MQDFIKKNGEVLKIVGAIVTVAVSTTWFMSHQMHSLENNLRKEIQAVDARLTNVEKNLRIEIHSLDNRLTVIETIMIMQGYPLKTIAANPNPESD